LILAAKNLTASAGIAWNRPSEGNASRLSCLPRSFHAASSDPGAAMRGGRIGIPHEKWTQG